MNRLAQYMRTDGRSGSDSEIKRVLRMLIVDDVARANSYAAAKQRLDQALVDHERTSNRLRAAECIGDSADTIARDCRKTLAALESDIRSARTAVRAYEPSVDLAAPCDLPPLEADVVCAKIFRRDVERTPLRDRVVAVDRTTHSYFVDLFDGRRIDLLSGTIKQLDRQRTEKREDSEHDRIREQIEAEGGWLL